MKSPSVTTVVSLLVLAWLLVLSCLPTGGHGVQKCIAPKDRDRAAQWILTCVESASKVETEDHYQVTRCENVADKLFGSQFCVQRGVNYVPCTTELEERFQESCKNAGWRP